MRLFRSTGRRLGAALAVPALAGTFVVSLMAGPAAASCNAYDWSASQTGSSAAGWGTWDCNGKKEVWGTLHDTSCDNISAHIQIRWINNSGIWTSTDEKYVNTCNTSGGFYFSRSAGSYSGAQACVNRKNSWESTGYTCTWAI